MGGWFDRDNLNGGFDRDDMNGGFDRGGNHGGNGDQANQDCIEPNLI